MQQYLELMQLVRDKGRYKEDRTGVGCYSLFGHQMRFDLSGGTIPLVTTKKCHLKSIIHELLWFLQGDTNIRYLKENGVNIWDAWIKEGTAEYRTLPIQERWELLKAQGGPSLKTYERYKEECEEMGYPRGPGVAEKDYHPEAMEDDHKYMDNSFVPREVLIAGELGPVYGEQWRSWPNPRVTLLEDAEEKARYMKSGLTYADWLSSDQARATVRDGSIDQIQNIINTLKNNPDSRRIIVSAWNPAQVDQMALPPCHALFQFYSEPMRPHEIMAYILKDEVLREKHREFVWDSVGSTSEEVEAFAKEHNVPTRMLSCQLYQRSADLFLGVPFNIASYALLTMMVAQVTGHALGEFIWTGGDCHIYSNHLEQVDLQLTRRPRQLPTMKIQNRGQDLFGFTIDDFELVGYDPYPHIPGKVAV